MVPRFFGGATPLERPQLPSCVQCTSAFFLTCAIISLRNRPLEMRGSCVDDVLDYVINVHCAIHFIGSNEL